jgi:hypothetical protein
MPLLTRYRHVHVCPLCGATVERVHRHFADRLFGMFRSVHRYRCLDESCGWEGIISTSETTVAADGATRPTLAWRPRALWFVAGMAVALAGAQGARMYLAHQAARQASEARAFAAAKRLAAAPLQVEVGQSYDGEILPDDDLRKAGNPSPLNLRRGCAWGIPGRNPYLGTVSQALTAARMPPSAVVKFEALIEKKLISDRVEITSEGITTASKRRNFDAASFDMAFGNTMCFNTRVNFQKGHVEHADLYEATDADGKRYAVMVPYVCGNVSVLADYEEKNGYHTNGQTPEPATWLMLVSGFTILAWFVRRRERQVDASAKGNRQ